MVINIKDKLAEINVRQEIKPAYCILFYKTTYDVCTYNERHKHV